ncbi:MULTISPECIES: hypothetical protein [Paraburkholderia]
MNSLGIANLSATENGDREIARRSAQCICNQHGEISYIGWRFLPDVIGFAMWLSYRFLLSLRMLEERPSARGIVARV